MISHIFLKREGFWSITPDDNKNIPDDFATSYTAIAVESNLRSAYSNVDEFAKVCANKIPLTATYDTMVITESPTDNKYLCYVTDMIDPATSAAPQTSTSTPTLPAPVPAPTNTNTLPMFADLTGLHSYCELLGSGEQKVCPDNQKLCDSEGADSENCCSGYTSVSINPYDNEQDKVTWRCTETSGLPWGGLTKCPPGYELAHKGNFLPEDKFDTCIRISQTQPPSESPTPPAAPPPPAAGAPTSIKPCPDGQELDGLLCYEKCRDGYTGVGPVCWKNCTDGAVDDDITGLKISKTCRTPIETYGLGAGRPADSRGGIVKGKECANKPPEVCAGGDCLPTSGWDKCANRGLFNECMGGVKTDWCGKRSAKTCNPGICTSYRSCPGGWVDDGLLCREPITYSCNGDEELVGGLCYPKCREGYTKDGLICRKGGEFVVKDSYGRGGGN